MRRLLGFAVARQWRPDNPAIGIKPLKIASDGFPAWSETEIARFEAYWPLGSRERLAIDLLLYTAQRSGDVRKMGLQHVRGGAILVRQEKTKAFLELPIHPRLQASLDTVPSGQMLRYAANSREVWRRPRARRNPRARTAPRTGPERPGVRRSPAR